MADKVMGQNATAPVKIEAFDAQNQPVPVANAVWTSSDENILVITPGAGGDATLQSNGAVGEVQISAVANGVTGGSVQDVKTVEVLGPAVSGTITFP